MDPFTTIASGAFALFVIVIPAGAYVAAMMVKGQRDRATPGTSGE